MKLLLQIGVFCQILQVKFHPATEFFVYDSLFFDVVEGLCSAFFLNTLICFVAAWCGAMIWDVLNIFAHCLAGVHCFTVICKHWTTGGKLRLATQSHPSGKRMSLPSQGLSLSVACLPGSSILY